MEVLSNAQKITAVVSELRGDLCIVNSALKKISARDSTLDINRITTLLQTGLATQPVGNEGHGKTPENNPKPT